MRPIWPQLTQVCGKRAMSGSASPTMATMCTASPRATTLSAIISGSRPPPARMPMRVMIVPRSATRMRRNDEPGVRIWGNLASRFGMRHAQRALAAGADEGNDLLDDRMALELLLHIVEALQQRAFVGK